MRRPPLARCVSHTHAHLSCRYGRTLTQHFFHAPQLYDSGVAHAARGARRRLVRRARCRRRRRAVPARRPRRADGASGARFSAAVLSRVVLTALRTLSCPLKHALRALMRCVPKLSTPPALQACGQTTRHGRRSRRTRQPPRFSKRLRRRTAACATRKPRCLLQTANACSSRRSSSACRRLSTQRRPPWASVLLPQRRRRSWPASFLRRTRRSFPAFAVTLSTRPACSRAAKRSAAAARALRRR